MWSIGRKEQGKWRTRRKEQWNSKIITLAYRLHQLAHQCKWGNHESQIRKWKIEEWPRHWKKNQWKDDEIPSWHELVEWTKKSKIQGNKTWIQKKVNHPSEVHKRIKYLLAIIVVSWVIHQTNVGEMEKKNSMENATIAISMIIGKISAKRNPSLKANVTNDARIMYTYL